VNAAPPSPARARDTWLPALAVLALGFACLALRPPIPVDETRYIEVLRESIATRFAPLQLRGLPYADKPPLLFVLGWLLMQLGLPLELAIRIPPVLASAGTVALVARVGRRAGAPLAGWLQAALLMPAAYASFLLVDPLLACAVWWTVHAWIRGRDVEAGLAAGVAFLSKGPVAALSLLPLMVAARPLRARPGRAWPRALAIVALGLVPLVAWALVAAFRADEAFRHELLWTTWAGRVQGSFAHARSVVFYAPVLLLGALPATLLLAARPAAFSAQGRRVLAALGVVVVLFSAFSGKQAHYLLPILPAVAWIGADRVGDGAVGSRGQLLVRRSVIGLSAFLALVLFAGLGFLTPLLERYGAYGEALRPRLAVEMPAVGLLLAGGAALAHARRARWDARTLLVAQVLVLAPCIVGLHEAGGALVVPRELRRELGALPAGATIAVRGSPLDGLFDLYSPTVGVEKLHTRDALHAWAAAHPGGFLVLEDRHRDELAGLATELVVADVARGEPYRLLRIGPGTALGQE